ncbi:transporter, major facilitator subfamily protein [Acanthamoeba castellanii str. Neff]|uniref:Transporter, major facilitator subfamily protein n=1 Tax=Acanthamoeba castellanii (strain ATCC 30010 / Neff) TaxID=1257118 RepID=L8HK94_ACACF|nr:transporter, major facilitator subfamily protein [Acanthamoeba castellanii str. Neff]ELR25627.1 transporter, major facilitator subfamily protein [Acanthamoeba castellanii str. Neff]
MSSSDWRSNEGSINVVDDADLVRVGQKPSLGAWGTIKYTTWLFFLCFSLAGVQFVYSIQFAIGTPLFRQKLKVSDANIAIILSTAGPISGFLVQPVIGVLSDACQFRFGRRRPFILGGALLCAAGMAIIGFSAFIGDAIGDSTGDDVGHHWRALIFAIAGLWIMNVAVNIMQGPARALVADVVDAEYQQLGNAMVSCTMGLAAVIGNVVGAQFLGTSEPYVYLFSSSLSVTPPGSMGIGLVLASTIPTLIVAGETPFVRPEGMKVNIFSVCGYSPFMIYITTFFGKNVNGGNPDADPPTVYQDGVKYGMYAQAGLAAVSLVYSFVLPYLVKFLGVRPTWFVTQAMQTACFILFLWFDQLWVAVLLTCVVGLNFTTFNSVPFALVTNMVATADAGMYMGVLNSAGVVAQTVTNSLASPILSWKDQNVAWAIAFGGILAGIASVLVWIVPSVPDKKQEDADDAPTQPLLRDV